MPIKSPMPRGAVSRRLLVACAAGAALVLAFASTQTCLRVGFRTGLWLDACPDGELRQTISLSAPALKRGAPGSVAVTVQANYVRAPNDVRFSETIHKFAPILSLVSSTGEQQLPPRESWARRGDSLTGEVELPKVNDGDYKLRARITSPIGEETLDLPLPLYTPARIHLLTDRPLYEAGNIVRFRALALKASDLSPLEERPGLWRVTNSEGEVLLEERAPTGAWGVVAGSFPLDRGAPSGQWTVTWHSGGQSESRTFTVKPFTLPRFRLEAAPLKPFYQRGERPVLKGSITYNSGAPVANAKLELSWNVSGQWPPPTSWVNGQALPKTATTNANGTFVAELPLVPVDLQGQSRLNARIGAVDASGDRVEGHASVLLSEDALGIEAVSELADGLVEGFNNRLFLRATTADGRVLHGATLNVKRLWEPSDKGVEATVDEDGVATLQVDPGPAVNVIIPALPFRPPPPVKPVTRQELAERLGLGVGGRGEEEESEEGEGGEVSLADRMAFDRLEQQLAACARFVLDDAEVQVGLLVRNSGALASMAVPATKLGHCVGGVLEGLRLGAGRERFFEVLWAFNDEELPRFEVQLDGLPQVPEPLEGALEDALLEARECLPATVKSGTLPRMLEWKVSGKSRNVELTWVPVRGGPYAPGALDCITSKVRSLKLGGTAPGDEEEQMEGSAIGVARISVAAPKKYEYIKPQDTVMVGYEFLVSAKNGNESLGSTKLRMQPGSIPSIRLRASSQLVKSGAQVTVEILRGPEFKGELPEKLTLSHAFETREAKVDADSRSATFIIPTDWQGWAGVQWGGGQVLFFVQPKAVLSVKVTPEKPRYAPGQLAQLGIETTVGAAGGQAAVGLFGVDDSLGELAPLPQADELASLRPQPTGTPAFSSLDAQALSLGRIRGPNAAAATLARISALPPPAQVDASVAVNGHTVFDPNEAQVDRFYAVLGELYAQTRAWESTAPAAEKMTPQLMAKLWHQSLEALEARKDSVRDAWGRRLRLHRLPMDLLALTEPRTVVVNGTRLPEDTQNWARWVAKEKP